MSTAKTRHFPDKVIAAVDDVLSIGAGITFNEKATSAHLSVPDPKKAEALRAALLEYAWHFTAEDAGGSRTVDQTFEPDYAPFCFDITKPEVDEDTVFIIHHSSLIEILEAYTPRVIRIGKDTHRFDLQSTVICSWDEPVEFVPAPIDVDPNRLVRDLSVSRLVPSDLSVWLLRSVETAPHGDMVFEEWKRHAASIYLRALSTEIEPDRALLFRGQPILRIFDPGPIVESMKDHFDELHSLVTWVYETKREAETRHGLVVAEIVRASMNVKSAEELIDNGFKGILESARHAYQLGLHKLSKDALQALSDLRKSVGDETSKAADFTRQMTTSVAGALFAAVGILAVRLTLVKDSEEFGMIAVIVGSMLFVYVAATAASGWYFISIQRSLRAKWKERTRKFLSREEYSELVEIPAKQAERVYKWTAFISLLAAFAAIAVIVWFSYPDAMTAAWGWLVGSAKSMWQMVSGASANSQNATP